MFYDQYYSSTVQSRKKQEFLTLDQMDKMIVEYQARLLTLERFDPDNFAQERDRAEKFVAGLRLSIQSIVSSFDCTTLALVVMRALVVEKAHGEAIWPRVLVRPIKDLGNRTRKVYSSRGGGLTVEWQCMRQKVYATEGLQTQRFL